MTMDTIAVERVVGLGRPAKSCVVLDQVGYNLDRTGTERLVAVLDPEEVEAHRNDRWHDSISVPGSSHRLRLKDDGGSRLAIAAGVVLRGQAPDELRAELARPLALLPVGDSRAKLKSIEVNLYLQTDEPFLPTLPLDPDLSYYGKFIGYGESGPHYVASHSYGLTRPEWLDTRAQGASVVHNGARAIGYRFGSESTGVVITACDEATYRFSDPRLRADLHHARGFDPDRSVRELGLSFHTRRISQLFPGALNDSVLEDALRKVPLYVADLVGGAVGDEFRRPFLRFVPEGPPVDKGWRPDSPLWTGVRETFLEALPKTKIYPGLAIANGHGRNVGSFLPASVLRRLHRIGRVLHG